VGPPFRFIRAFDAWSNSQVTQSRNRSQDRIPSVDEFILMRRATIGGALVEGKNTLRSLSWALRVDDSLLSNDRVFS
jgi:hypothetical protein